jgi:hypothetical protein
MRLVFLRGFQDWMDLQDRVVGTGWLWRRSGDMRRGAKLEWDSWNSSLRLSFCCSLGAYVLSWREMALGHFSYSLENVRDGVCPSDFGVEGRFGSIT